MERNPYTPPKALVADDGVDRPSPWKRAKWGHFATFAALTAFFAALSPAFAPHFTLRAALVGVVLSFLFLYHPVRNIPLLRESGPWWWDSLYLVSLGLFLLSALFDNAEIMIATVLPTILMNAVLPLVIWRVERRQSVQVYVKGRRYVYVPIPNRL